jgi:hypothetical protein
MTKKKKINVRKGGFYQLKKGGRVVVIGVKQGKVTYATRLNQHVHLEMPLGKFEHAAHEQLEHFHERPPVEAG